MPRGRIIDKLLMRSAIRTRFESAHERRLSVNSDGVVVGAETLFLKAGSRRAALLLHGFNDTPQSMAYLAHAMHRSGWTVLVPRLAGHGVRLDVMARESRAKTWRRETERAYVDLCGDYDDVVVCGQSMGGALATLLAARHPEMPALVLLAPYLGMPVRLQLQVAAARMMQLFTPYHASSGGERSIHDPVAKAEALGARVITARTMTELRTVARTAESALRRLRVPTLYLQSRDDNRIATSDAEKDFARIGSEVKEQRWLTGCGHIITADYCRDAVAQQVIEWCAKYTAAESE